MLIEIIEEINYFIFLIDCCLMVERKLLGELSQCHLFYQFYDLIYISIDIRLIGKMDTMQKSFTNKFNFFRNFSSFILSL